MMVMGRKHTATMGMKQSEIQRYLFIHDIFDFID